ncbi:MAG: PAS domain-containing protein, partial [Myxococcaceae bacterium]|nr:PAS domain-containing protein [Myxococcaceae bacterium]
MPSSSEAPPARTAAVPVSDLRVKLLWLSIFRMVATSLLLALLAIRLLGAPRPTISGEDSLSFVVIGVVYLMTLLYALLLRGSEVRRAAAWVQLLGDVLVATSLVYLTGGAESPFTFTYLLATVAGALLLYQRGAVVVAIASTFAFALLVGALQLGLLSMPPGASTLAPPRLAFVIGSNALAQLLTAALAGYLSRQLLTTGGRLRAREQDFRRLATVQNQILAAMPSGLVTCNASGEVTFVNRAAESIFGRKPGSAVGMPLDALIPGARQIGPAHRRQTLEVETPHGRRTLGLSVAPLEPFDGSLLIVFQDLTEIRRLEEELRRVDRLAAVGRMAAQLAHEIRNPLAAMRGSAQLLAQTTDPLTAPRLSNILVREADRLSRLLEDFLEYA